MLCRSVRRKKKRTSRTHEKERAMKLRQEVEKGVRFGH